MSTTFDTVQLPLASYQNINNILDNGGFEIWQRGTSFSSLTNGTYTTDRWKIFNTGTAPVGTITQESSTVDNSQFAMKINFTSVAGNGSWGLRQDVENYKSYLGKTLTVTARINSSASAGFYLLISDGLTNGLAAVTTTSGYATFTASIVPSNSATQIYVIFGNVFGAISSTGTWYLDNFMLTVGSNPVPFVATNPQQDLARCQRFYEIPGTTYGVTFRALGINNGSQYQLSQYIPFKVRKRILPTMTITIPLVWEEGSTTNQAANYSAAAANADEAGFEFEAGKAAGGNKPTLLQGQWTASADF